MGQELIPSFSLSLFLFFLVYFWYYSIYSQLCCTVATVLVQQLETAGKTSLKKCICFLSNRIAFISLAHFVKCKRIFRELNS